ncbi:Uncharacterised protein [Lysinibacillus sphaericus]|nr:Uncharacterised protein [Lysinibacillus sphaericus]
MFSNSIATLRALSLLTFWCFKIGSIICLPIVIVGFNDVIGSWKIIEISLPRIFCISRSDNFVKSFPSNRISPFLNSELDSGNNRMMDFVVTDLPEPDSPTIASVSPLFKSKFTPRIAFTSPANVWKESSKSLTCNILLILLSSYQSFIFGSSASRKPSPIRLKAIIKILMTRDGNNNT